MGKYINNEIKNIFIPRLRDYFGKRGLPKLHWNVFSKMNEGTLTLRIDSNFKTYEKELLKLNNTHDKFIDRLHVLNNYILEHIYVVCPELQNEYIIIYVTDSKYKVFDLTYVNRFGTRANTKCFACYKNFKVINDLI